MGKSLKDMGTRKKFLNRTAMACAVRSRIDKWDLMKLPSFCKAKDTASGAFWGSSFLRLPVYILSARHQDFSHFPSTNTSSGFPLPTPTAPYHVREGGKDLGGKVILFV